VSVSQPTNKTLKKTLRKVPPAASSTSKMWGERDGTIQSQMKGIRSCDSVGDVEDFFLLLLLLEMSRQKSSRRIPSPLRDADFF